MQQHPFIFSNEPKYRIGRHVAFWGFWWLFQGFLYAFTPSLFNISYWARIPSSMIDSLLFLVAHIFLAYSLMYFVVPKYILKHKYLAASVWVLVLFLLTAILSSLIALYVLEELRVMLLPDRFKLSYRNYRVSFFMGLLGGLRGGITIGGLAAAIKLMKHWYIKEQRNLQLQKENVESQLQLLKAQVHPHFLFNTLNNIYAHTQNTSPMAAKLVMGLSDMLRFMLYEGSQPYVPLGRDLQMIAEYIELEKIRYDNHLDVNLDIPTHDGQCMIAPLLLLPLVENCFKHGTSNMLEQPWLSFQVHLQENVMHMKLVNGKPQEAPKNNNKRGIGISNVRKRLELLYPGKHELTILDDTDVFIVNLTIELERNPSFSKKQSTNFALTHE
jgi:sensor histidine kinase YesM